MSDTAPPPTEKSAADVSGTSSPGSGPTPEGSAGPTSGTTDTPGAGLSRAGMLLVAVLAGGLAAHKDVWTAYVPGFDEAWMLQASVRLARGDGLTHITADDWSDLATPQYQHMNHWPPVHPWLFAGLLKLGVPAATALQWVAWGKLLAGVVGAWGWLRLGARFLPAADVLFAGLALAGAWYVHESSFEAAPGHLFAWAAMPWYLAALCDGVRTGSTTACLRAGCLLALMIGWRFHLATLPGAAGLAVLLLSPGTWVQRLVRSVVTGLPAAAFLGAVMLYNRAESGTANWVEGLGAQPDSTRLVCREPLTFLTGFGFGVEEGLCRVKPGLRDQPFAVFAGWYALLAAVPIGVWLLRRRIAAGATADEVPPLPGLPGALGRAGFWCRSDAGARAEGLLMLRVVALHAAMLVALLAWVSRRAAVAGSWVPIEQLRMYAELAPAVGLVWLAGMALLRRHVTVPWQRVGVALIGAVAVAGVIGGVVRTAREGVRAVRSGLQRGFGAESPVVARVRELLAGSPVPDKAVFDGGFLVLARPRVLEPDVRGERYMEPVPFLARVGNSRPLYCVVVALRFGGRSDGNWEGRMAVTYARFLGLPSVGIVGDDREEFEVFAGVVPPFPPGSRAGLLQVEGKPSRQP